MSSNLSIDEFAEQYRIIPTEAQVITAPRAEPENDPAYSSWLKKYGIINPDDPRHFYDYYAAYKAGIVPEQWKSLPEVDKAEDIAQGRNISEDAYMWPDKFKKIGHPFPGKEPSIDKLAAKYQSNPTQTQNIPMPESAPTQDMSPNIDDLAEKYRAPHLWNQYQQVVAGGKSLLGKVGNVLARGSYGTGNVLNKIQEIEARGKGETLDPKEAADLFWQGIKGEQKHTIGEAVQKVLPPDTSGWVSFPLKFAAEMLLDPTTYIPAGIIAKGIGKGVKALGSIDALAEAYRTVRSTPPVTAFLGPNVPKEYAALKSAAKLNLREDQAQFINEIGNIRKGISADDWRKLTYFHEHPQDIGELTPELQTALVVAGRKYDDLTKSLLDSGKITQETYDAWKASGIPYAYRSYAEGGQHRVQGILPPTWMGKTQKPSFLKERTFATSEDAKRFAYNLAAIEQAPDLTTAQGLIQKHGLTDYFDDFGATTLEDIHKIAKKGSKIYTPEEHMLKNLGLRGLEQTSFMARDKFVDDTLTKFGKRVAPGVRYAPEGEGIYLPKGKSMIVLAEMVSPSFKRVLEDFAENFRGTRTVEQTLTTEATTRTIGQMAMGELATEGPRARMEEVVRGALTSRGFTPEEANLYIQKLKVNGPTAVNEVMERVENTTSTIRTVLSTEEAQGGLINLSGEIGDYIKKIPLFTTRVPTYRLPKEIADDMNKSSELFMGTPEAKWFLKWMVDKPLNAFKTMATIWRPPFHIRNAESNLMLAFQAGVTNPRRFIQAADIQIEMAQTMGKPYRKAEELLGMATGPGKTIELGGTTYAYDDLMNMMKREGVKGGGWVGGDIQVTALKDLKNVLGEGILKYMNLNKFARAIGTGIEDNARIAVFIDQLDKGSMPTDAALQVAKHLYNYGDKTVFEKHTMMRLFPWYQWLRKNTERQVETLISKPRKFQVYEKGLRSYGQPETAEEKLYKPAYFDEFMYVKSAEKTNEGKPLYQGIDMPNIDINNLGNIKDTFINSLNPFVKEFFYAGLAGVKSFPKIGTPIADRPTELTPAPAWVNLIPAPLRIPLENHKIIRQMVDPESGLKVLGIRKTWLYAAHAAMPFLNEMDRMFPGSIKLSDESPARWKERYFTGISKTPLDTERGVTMDAKAQEKYTKDIAAEIIQTDEEVPPDIMKELKPENLRVNPYE